MYISIALMAYNINFFHQLKKLCDGILVVDLIYLAEMTASTAYLIHKFFTATNQQVGQPIPTVQITRIPNNVSC